MIIATFGPATEWVGKTITFEDGQFILEGHGMITARAVLEYDRHGHLTWAYDDLRGWVDSIVAASRTSQAATHAVAPAASAADKAVRAEAMMGAGSRPTPVQIVDLNRVSRGDWVVVAGFLALLLGTSLAWYSFSGLYVGYRAMGGAGWDFKAGWVSWLAGLVAVAVVLSCSGVIPLLHIGFRGRAPLIVSGLGGLAILSVFFGLLTKPAYDEGFGVGILVSLVGATAVTVGGLLKLGEPVPTVMPSAAADAAHDAMNSAKVAFTAAREAVATRNAPLPSPVIPVRRATTNADPIAAATPTPLRRPRSFVILLVVGIALAAVLLAIGLPMLSSKLTPQEIYQKNVSSVVQIQATFPGTNDVYGQQTGGGEALGTGFVVSKDGYILTNAHVVSESGQAVSTVTVVFKDSGSHGKHVEGTVVSADESTDVALIKVDPDKTPRLVPLPLGDSSKATVGEAVVAIGNPLGLNSSLSLGVVSATNRDLDAPNGSTISGGIQTDAAINPGSSGGPLIDSTGHVIGINEQIDTWSGGNEGIGFAVPINTAISVMKRMMKADAAAQ